MKKSILALLAVAGLSTASYAKSVYSPVENCGANTWSERLFGPYYSDMSGGMNLPADHSLRAVVVRSSKGTTTIHRLTAYDDRRGPIDYVNYDITLGEDQEYYFCVGRRQSLSSIYIETSDPDRRRPSKFRVYTYN